MALVITTVDGREFEAVHDTAHGRGWVTNAGNAQGNGATQQESEAWCVEMLNPRCARCHHTVVFHTEPGLTRLVEPYPGTAQSRCEGFVLDEEHIRNHALRPVQSPAPYWRRWVEVLGKADDDLFTARAYVEKMRKT